MTEKRTLTARGRLRRVIDTEATGCKFTRICENPENTAEYPSLELPRELSPRFEVTLVCYRLGEQLWGVNKVSVTGRVAANYFGLPVDGYIADIPVRGETFPSPEDALDRVMTCVQHTTRYYVQKAAVPPEGFQELIIDHLSQELGKRIQRYLEEHEDQFTTDVWST